MKKSVLMMIVTLSATCAVLAGISGPARAQLADLITPTGDHHLRAITGKGDGGGTAYACEASRNQNDWIVHGVAPDVRFVPISS